MIHMMAAVKAVLLFATCVAALDSGVFESARAHESAGQLLLAAQPFSNVPLHELVEFATGGSLEERRPNVIGFWLQKASEVCVGGQSAIGPCDAADLVARADAVYRIAAARATVDTVMLHNFGILRQRMGDSVAAEQLWRAAISAGASQPGPYIELGLQLRSRNNYTAALQVFIQGLTTCRGIAGSHGETALVTNLLTSIISAKSVPAAVLREAFNHPALLRATRIYPSAAVLRVYSMLRACIWEPDSSWSYERALDALTRTITLLLGSRYARKNATWLAAASHSRSAAVTKQALSDWLQTDTEQFSYVDVLNSLSGQPAGPFLLSSLLLTAAFELSYLPVSPLLGPLAAAIAHEARNSKQYPDDSIPLVERLTAADTAQRLATLQRWWEGVSTQQSQKRTIAGRKSRAVRPKLRLGYISPDLRVHAIGFMVLGLFASHDRSRSGFSVNVYHVKEITCGPPEVTANCTDWMLKQSSESPAAGADARAAAAAHVDMARLAAAWEARHLVMAIEGGNTTAPVLKRHRVASLMCNNNLESHTSRLAAAADHFYTPLLWPVPLSDRDIVDHMAAVTQPHILIDLGGPTFGSRPAIVAARPAPVTIHYLSGPVSVGDRAFGDYFLVDATVLPPDTTGFTACHGGDDACRVLAEGMPGGYPEAARMAPHSVSMTRQTAVLRHYTESLIYLPQWFQANTYPRLCSDLPQSTLQRSSCASVALAPCRQHASLSCPPPGTLVLAALHNSYKLHPDSFTAWMNILRRYPNAVLWLLQPGSLGATVREQLIEEAAARGVPPHRLRFLQEVPRTQFWALFPCVDVFLDTWIYGAHSTGADAIRFGVPLVSLRTDTFATRVLSSLVVAAGQLGSADAAGSQVQAAAQRQDARTQLHLASLLLTHTGMEYESTVNGLLQDGGAPARHLKFRILQHLEAVPANASAPAAPFDYTTLTHDIERAYHSVWELRSATHALSNTEDWRWHIALLPAAARTA